jgi:hypothetical protein
VTNEQAFKLALNLHTRTCVGLVDAAHQAVSSEQRTRMLEALRDELLDFKREVQTILETLK